MFVISMMVGVIIPRGAVRLCPVSSAKWMACHVIPSWQYIGLTILKILTQIKQEDFRRSDGGRAN